MAFSANAQETVPSNCSLCKTTKHPLYTCPQQFKLLSHDKMSTIHTSNVCLNCLKPGHFSRNCSSNNHCQKCQKSHHTLLHSDTKQATEQPSERTVTSTPSGAILSVCSANRSYTLSSICFWECASHDLPNASPFSRWQLLSSMRSTRLRLHCCVSCHPRPAHPACPT